MSDTNATPHYLLLFSGEAKKIGIRSTGSIRFQVLADESRQTLWLRLFGNDSSGCFSTELVAFSTIETCVQGVQEGRPLASKAMASCFKGRSSNNGPFLCAALRSLGLLSPLPENMSLSQPAGDWQAWKKTMLEAEGDNFALPEKDKPVAGKTIAENSEAASKSPEHSEPTKAPARAPKRGKPPVTEGNDAGHPANE